MPNSSISPQKKNHHKKTHGMTESPEYVAWCCMKQRCEYPPFPQWADYGGRGISVCSRWRDSFENFYTDMGPRPSPKHSIDRIDNNGDYEPGNVRWSTHRQQQNNMRSNRLITYNGETLTMAQWSRKLSINYLTLSNRLNRNGWPIERAFTEPVRK